MNNSVKNTKYQISLKINNQNNIISNREIVFLIKNPPAKKTPHLNGFICELYETLKEDIVQILQKLFQKIDDEESLPNS